MLNITEVSIKLWDKGNLKAFCSVTLGNSFVIRDLRIIETPERGMFVSMPTRKVGKPCTFCSHKNALTNRYCGKCGKRLPEAPPARDHQFEKPRLYADICHPINSDCRDYLHHVILDAYQRELIESRKPGYRPSYEPTLLED